MQLCEAIRLMMEVHVYQMNPHTPSEAIFESNLSDCIRYGNFCLLTFFCHGKHNLYLGDEKVGLSCRGHDMAYYDWWCPGGGTGETQAHCHAYITQGGGGTGRNRTGGGELGGRNDWSPCLRPLASVWRHTKTMSLPGKPRLFHLCQRKCVRAKIQYCEQLYIRGSDL